MAVNKSDRASALALAHTVHIAELKRRHMSKQPTTDPNDALGRLLETAGRMDDRLRGIEQSLAKLLADYEADKAIEDVQRRAEYERQMRQGLQSPYLARGFLANQQPRLDGDNRPWEPRK